MGAPFQAATLPTAVSPRLGLRHRRGQAGCHHSRPRAGMSRGSSGGIGQRAIVARTLLETGLVFGAIFRAGALGDGLNLPIPPLQRRFVRRAGR